MPKLTGGALLQAKSEGTATSGGSKGRKPGTFTPLFRLKEVGETAFIKFVRDDLEEVFLHTFVRVPARNPEKNKYGHDFEVFASRSRNPEFGDATSLLEDELDHWPVKKIAGIAVLLDPVYDGQGTKLKNLKRLEVQGNTVTYDKEDVFFPNWNFIFEAHGTFWENLVMIHNSYGIDEYPLQVTKVARDSYNFIALTDQQVEIDEEKVPTVASEIARLGSEERYEHYFGKGKPRISQDQKHIWLPEWIQKERAEKLGVELETEESEDVKVQAEEVPPTRKKRKSRVDFDAISELADDKEKDIEPYTPEDDD